MATLGVRFHLAAITGAAITGIAAILAPCAAWAASFSPTVHNSEWMVEGSEFGCRMAQPIPEFGKAVFFHEAGETLHFYLEADSPRMKSGRAAVKIINPIWKPDGKARSLGYVDVRQDQSSIDIEEKLANKMLQELYAGQQVQFSRQSWYDAAQTVSVAISNVNFRAAYDQYVTCLADLLPVNLAQIERTSLVFKPGQELLSDKETDFLDDILVYVDADKTIQSFYIDGHSDSQGTRSENLETSKRRAEKVMKYLVAGGIERDKIVLRWHGERYPVASNRTAAGRAQNRRVTVRLSKEPAPQMPEIQTAVAGNAIDTEALKEALGEPPKKVPPTIAP